MDMFGILVRHFLAGFLDRDSLSSEGEPETSVAQLLGLMATPGAFFVLLFRPFGATEWGLVSVRTFMIALSMLFIGFAMVFQWGALFPDRRDYQILTPLPTSVRKIFLAKLAALGLTVAVLLGVTNGLSVLLWPGVDTGPGFFHSLLSHLVACCSAGLFMALAAAAVQGAMATLFWGGVLRRVSAALQTLFMAGLVAFMMLTPYFSATAHGQFWMKSKWMYIYPPYWFAGLYEMLRPAAKDAELARHGWIALAGLATATCVLLLTYVPFYRVHARRAVEAPEPDPKGPGFLGLIAAHLLDRWLLPRPVERAVFHFISQTIVRSAKHRLLLAGYGGLGAGIIWLGYLMRNLDPILLPLLMSFILITGLRAAFTFPAELRANWAMRITGEHWLTDALRGMRKWIVCCAILPLFALSAVPEFCLFAPWTAAYHLAFGIGTSVLLMDVVFLGFQKAPFACSYDPSKFNAVGMLAIYILGLVGYSRILAWLETNLQGAFEIAVYFAVLALGRIAIRRWRNGQLAEGAAVEYEDHSPVVQTLGYVER